jgi:phosphopantetheinyl transferase
MDYVLAENNCCPFFDFNISLHSDDDVALEISGTEEVIVFIKDMVIEK